MQKIGQRKNENHKIYETNSWKLPKFTTKQSTQEIYICINKKIKMRVIKPCVVEKMSRSRSCGS